MEKQDIYSNEQDDNLNAAVAKDITNSETVKHVGKYKSEKIAII